MLESLKIIRSARGSTFCSSNHTFSEIWTEDKFISRCCVDIIISSLLFLLMIVRMLEVLIAYWKRSIRWPKKHRPKSFWFRLQILLHVCMIFIYIARIATLGLLGHELLPGFVKLSSCFYLASYLIACLVLFVDRTTTLTTRAQKRQGIIFLLFWTIATVSEILAIFSISSNQWGMNLNDTTREVELCLWVGRVVCTLLLLLIGLRAQCLPTEVRAPRAKPKPKELKEDEENSKTADELLQFLSDCKELQFCKLPTSHLQDKIIRLGRKWMQLSPKLVNLSKIFNYPCQQLFTSEIRAQFHYFMGTCLLKMVQEKAVRECDGISMTTALFGLSLGEGSKQKKNLLNMQWKEDEAEIVSRLSCSRVSQTWHFLVNILEEKGSDIFIHHQKKWYNESGYHQMLNQVLGLNQDGGTNPWVIPFVSQLSFHPLTVRGLENRQDEIAEIDYECIIDDQNNLPSMVWMCMQWDDYDIETAPIFVVFMKKKGLRFEPSNLSQCSVKYLSILDIVIFLHAVAHCMQEELEKRQQYLQLNSIPLKCYPYPMLNFGNQRQIDWFNAVHQHLEVKGSSKDFIVIVEKGLQVLRCRSHDERMGTELLIYLGRMMKELMLKNKGSQSDNKRYQAYEERCLLYWQEALKQLEKLKNGENILESRNPLFPHRRKTFTVPEVDELIEEAHESLAECQPEAVQSRTKTPAQLPYTPSTPEDRRLDLPSSSHVESDERQGMSYLLDTSYPEPSTSGRFASPSKRSPDRPMMTFSPGYSRRQLSPVSPRENVVEPFHSTPSGRIHSSTLSWGSHGRHQPPQYEVIPVDSFHSSLHEEPRGSPDGSDVPLETSSFLYKTAESHSKRYLSSVADDTNYEIEVTVPSTEREVCEIRDLTRSQHRQEARNDELKVTLRESHEKALIQNKQISETNKKLAESALALEAEQREVTNRKVDVMSGEIIELKKRLTDAENNIQVVESVQEDQNQKNLELYQGVVSQLEELRKKNRDHETWQETMKQTLLMFQEVLQTNSEKLRQQIEAQKEQEKYNNEIQESLNELHQKQKELEGLRSELKQMEQLIGKLDNSYAEMGTRMNEILENMIQNNETARLYQQTFEQSIQEMKMNVERQEDDVEEAMKDLKGKIEAIRTEVLAETSHLPQQVQSIAAAVNLTPEADQLQPGYPHTVTYVPHPLLSGCLIPVEVPFSPEMLEGRGTPPEKLQNDVGGPSMQAGGDAGRQPSPPGQVLPSATTPIPVPPARGMRTTPLQFQSPTSAQFTPVLQQPASPNLGQRVESSASPITYNIPAADQTQHLTVAEDQPGISSLTGPPTSVAAPTTQGYTVRSPAPVHHHHTPQPTPPSRAGPSPFTRLPLTSTPSRGVSRPTSQVPETSMTIGVPRKGTSVPKGFTPAKPSSISQQEQDVLNIPVRRPGENFITVTPREGGDLTPGETSKGLAEEMSSSFGSPDIFKLNFASIAAAGDAGYIRRDPSRPFSQFPGAGSQVFGSPSTTQQEEDSITGDEELDPHFEPIISLPENVDLTTGDEGQEVVFKERAKLYRYDSDTQAWKERGVGDMKILRDPETGKARILMRRDQVLKVCANHWLTPDMQLLPMSPVDRAFIWNAIDFAEGEECHEQFAVKFRTPELATEFKKTFDKMKEGTGQKVAEPPEPVTEEPAEPVQDTPASPEKEELGDQFSQGEASKPGDKVTSQEQLGGEKTYDQMKEGFVPKVSDPTEPVRKEPAEPVQHTPASPEKEDLEDQFPQTETAKSGDELRSQEELGEEKEAAESEREKEDEATKDEDESHEESQLQVQVGESAEEGKRDIATTEQQRIFSTPRLTLSSGVPQFAFSYVPPRSNSAALTPQSAFGSPPRLQQQSAGFSFGISPPRESIPREPSPKDQPVPPASDLQIAERSLHGSGPSYLGKKEEKVEILELVKSQGKDSLHPEVEEAHLSSSPAAKSSPKSQGSEKAAEHYQDENEESEKVKFSQNAKLSQFNAEDSKWKERGVGDIKVLYNPETRKHRIFMRRDEDSKVCANHFITQDVNLQPTAFSERSWVWHAMDISDGEPQNEQLAVRFKTEDAAKEFKEVVDEAKQNIPETSDQPEEPIKKTEMQKEPVPTVSDIQEEREVGREREDKTKDLTRKETEDQKAVVEVKDTEEETARPIQDVKTKEKAEAEEKREKEKEQDVRQEKKEDVTPASEKTKAVATKNEDVKPSPANEEEENIEPTPANEEEEDFKLSPATEEEDFKPSPATEEEDFKPSPATEEEEDVKPSPASEEEYVKPIPEEGKELEDQKAAVEFKETEEEPARPTQDEKTKEKVETEEEPARPTQDEKTKEKVETEEEPARPTQDEKTKEKVETEEETVKEKKKEVKEEKENLTPVSEKTKDGDVATKEEDVKPSLEEAKDKTEPEKVPGKENSKESLKVSYKPPKDMKTKKDEETRQGKDEDSLKEKKGKETEAKKEISSASPETGKDNDIKEKDTLSPSTKAVEEIKQEETSEKLDSEKKEDDLSKTKEDVTSKEKDEVKEAGKDEEALKEKAEGKTKKEKKETSSASPETDKDKDVKEKDTSSPSTEAVEEIKHEETPEKLDPEKKEDDLSKTKEDVTSKEKDEVKEAGKDEEALKEKAEGETKEEKKKPSPAAAAAKTKVKDGEQKQKDTEAPSTRAVEEIKQEETSEKKRDDPSKTKEGVTLKEKDKVKDIGKNKEEALKEKTKGKTKEEKKKPSPAAAAKTKVKDGGQKQKDTEAPSTEDQQQGDEEPSKPADEETPEEEEEKEEDSSREIRFSAPADLSYADENKDWKLRGKGQFQILFDNDSKNYSVEMKNDKDNSLCAKHPITKGIQLIPVRGQDRSYTWSAMDSSDKEDSPVPMVFAVRFKDRETADRFQEEFQKAQPLVAEPPQGGKGKGKKEQKKKESKKGNNKKDPSLHSSQASLAPSQASLDPSHATSQPEDAPQSPKSPKSPKDVEIKTPKKEKKKGFFRRVKDKVVEMLESSDESDGGSSSASSSSESSSDEDEKKD